MNVAINPLWRREWLASSRLARTPWLIALAGVSLGALLLFVGVTSSSPSSDVGRRLFHVCFTMTTLFVTLFGPAIAANAIALEREGKTWEALLMAGVTPRTIDRGKFWGSYTHLGVYLLALVPSFGIPHLFGGVSIAETLLAVVLVLALGGLAVRFGLLLSAIVPSTRSALLVTLCASAALCFFVVLVGAGAGSFLYQEAHMQSLESEAPVVWPVALVNERFGFDYVRYLLLVPIGGVVLGWYGLRELTVYALDTTSAKRPHRITYAALLLGVAVVLGLIPAKPVEVIGVEVMFALVTFVAIVIVGGDHGKRSTLGRSLTLAATSTAGMFIVCALGSFVAAWTSGEVSSQRERESLEHLLVYGPAFTLFLTGLAGLFQSLFQRAVVSRAVTVATTIALTIAPLLAAAFATVNEKGSSRDVLVLSPIGAIVTNDNLGLVVLTAFGWAVLGAGLLVTTHLRARHASRANEQT